MRKASGAVAATLAATFSAVTPKPLSTSALAPQVMAPEASQALSRAAVSYADGASHVAGFVQSYTPSGFATARRESGTIWIQAPQRLRFDYAAPEKKTFTYDAGEGRFFSPEDKQLTVRKLSAEEKARLPIVFLSDPDELAREYEIFLESSGVPGSTRILLKPRSPRPELAWLRLSIEEDGDVQEIQYQDVSGNRSGFQFAGWQKEKPRPAADFRITGPPGTRIVEN